MPRFPFNKTMADGSEEINFGTFQDLQNVLGFDVTSTLRVFFADQEEIVDSSSNRIRCTVNPLLTPLPFG